MTAATLPLPVRLLRNERGATVVEFAMVAPAFILALIGFFDLSYNIYAAAMVEGAIQKAARDSTIEGAALSTGDIDSRVTRAVTSVIPSANVAFDRSAYSNFSEVGLPEDFTDTNSDGACNDGEPFEDANGNGIWDADRGQNGLGGARDAVLYTVTVTYDRQFPLHKFIGVSEEVTTVVRTVLRNQPYSLQATEITVGNCT